jgi:hypothetical protein
LATCIEKAGVAYFLTLECFLQREECHVWWCIQWDGPMEPKITLLFLLIVSVIGLSRLDDEFVERVRRQLGEGRWREMLPRRRRV